MGWGSAGGLFNEITHAMIDAGVSGEKLTDICEKMIKEFQESDWDTEVESLEAFEHIPSVVEAFRRCGVHGDKHKELADFFVNVLGVPWERAETLAHKFLSEMVYVAGLQVGDDWTVRITHAQ
jgi:hypothetical protein